MTNNSNIRGEEAKENLFEYIGKLYRDFCDLEKIKDKIGYYYYLSSEDDEYSRGVKRYGIFKLIENHGTGCSLEYTDSNKNKHSIIYVVDDLGKNVIVEITKKCNDGKEETAYFENESVCSIVETDHKNKTITSTKRNNDGTFTTTQKLKTDL